MKLLATAQLFIISMVKMVIAMNGLN